MWQNVAGVSADEMRRENRERVMSEYDNVYRKIEVVGSSSTSIEDAIQNAVSRADSTLDHVEWFEVVETRGHVKDGKVAHFQVALKIGFRMNDPR